MGLSEGLKNLDHDLRGTGLLLGWVPTREDEKLFWMLHCLHASEMKEPGKAHAIWKECKRDLEEWCGDAVINGEASFFEKLAAMLRRIEGGGSLPIDWMVLHYKAMMEPKEYAWVKTKKDRERLRKLRTYNISNSRSRGLPVWPASPKELHEFVNSQVKCSERAVRDAAERLGVPLRPDPKNRGRRRSSD